jgi:hypothetical protein
MTNVSQDCRSGMVQAQTRNIQNTTPEHSVSVLHAIFVIPFPRYLNVQFLNELKNSCSSMNAGDFGTYVCYTEGND